MNEFLYSSCKSGFVSTVKYLLEVSKCNPNTPTKYNNVIRTPLEVACFVGNVKIVKLLLEHGAIIDTDTNSGFNCMYFAKINNRTDVIDVLNKQKSKQS